MQVGDLGGELFGGDSVGRGRLRPREQGHRPDHGESDAEQPAARHVRDLCGDVVDVLDLEPGDQQGDQANGHQPDANDGLAGQADPPAGLRRVIGPDHRVELEALHSSGVCSHLNLLQNPLGLLAKHGHADCPHH